MSGNVETVCGDGREIMRGWTGDAGARRSEGRGRARVAREPGVGPRRNGRIEAPIGGDHRARGGRA